MKKVFIFSTLLLLASGCNQVGYAPATLQNSTQANNIAAKSLSSAYIYGPENSKVKVFYTQLIKRTLSIRALGDLLLEEIQLSVAIIN